ncbi:Spermine/spermidine synthase family protein [Penicillium cosmopolitanum]|uniref:Spermine/spermidine synthase family protein n=1 Tax=Penicillium cosmopolitanum TaxID=1131564 RepID=A0A9W9W355_9EURO|nr:Spermine/spermidine synthase family protein [Penicillium cosmopolitanum]KAJ5397601.1 Spermine/spermidine synthase family protein [Penicillium cosmopolitanum]
MSIEQFIQQADLPRLGSGVALLFLAAFYSPVMLLVLSPVYGALPSHIFHSYAVGVFGIAGWFLKDHIMKRFGRVAAYMLPVLAFWTPTLQYFLMQQSSKLGNPAGPVITELFGYLPMVTLTVAIAGKQIQYALHLEAQGDLVVEHVPLLATYAIYSASEHIAKAILSSAIGFTVLFTRAGLQFIIAALYAAVIPSKMLLLAIPSVLFSLSSDVHLGGISGVNNAIRHEGYKLLERQESYTGYISVLENQNDGFRVMRCDHSLLGGQWTKSVPGYKPEVEDPIYAVFAMLEAVRLVEPDHGTPRVDTNSKALVIGLGIGTTPAALMKHGIDTTIVELDPVVHKFATKYFNLQDKHNVAIEDATKFVARQQKSIPHPQYDYIVHDVFTGGAEPAELFTIQFLENLKSLLKEDGAIAINYAGDLNLYPTGLVVRTILAAFPSCRIFREHPAERDSENPDFTNMVLFCKKSSKTPVEFRDAVPADFLRSRSRESYLVPTHEMSPALFSTIPKDGKSILLDDEVGRLYKYQDRGALEHWAIMRKVIPDSVWENW